MKRSGVSLVLVLDDPRYPLFFSSAGRNVPFLSAGEAWGFEFPGLSAAFQ